jgi:hypothetical protein
MCPRRRVDLRNFFADWILFDFRGGNFGFRGGGIFSDVRDRFFEPEFLKKMKKYGTSSAEMEIETRYGFGWSAAGKSLSVAEFAISAARRKDLKFISGKKIFGKIAEEHPHLADRVDIVPNISGIKKLLPPIILSQKNGDIFLKRSSRKIVKCQYCNGEFRWGKTKKGSFIPYEKDENGNHRNHRGNCPNC